MTHNKLTYLTRAAAIAAIYILLTGVSALFGLSGGAIQFRLSEALGVLPAFLPEAVPGLIIGCLGADLLTGDAPWDIVFGTAATALGAVVCRLIYFRRKPSSWAALPNILANTLIVPFVLRYVYGAEGALPILVLTVGIGEVVTGGVGGILLMKALQKHPEIIR